MQTTVPVTLGWELHDAVLKLAYAIKALPEWQELQDARASFQTDPQMAAILARYRRAFGRWTAVRRQGQALAGSDAMELAESQQQLEEHPAYLRQHEASIALVTALQNVNRVLSAELEVDFAANATPRGGGCCG